VSRLKTPALDDLPAGYSDSEILAIVTVAVQALLTNFINNVNQTDIDIPAVHSVG
jgi:hypothetical protein